LLVAIASSSFRFGQRENEGMSWSDSDYYIDMAHVFSGEKEAFNKGYLETRPHHYARPLFSYFAAKITSLGLSLKTSFSVLNVLAAWIIAVIFYIGIVVNLPCFQYAWMPPFLFLTGFPQLNWGYHILTDTFGYGFSIIVIFIMDMFFIYASKHEFSHKKIQYILGILLLFILQSLAFFAREIAWAAVIVAVYFFLKHLITNKKISYFYVVVIITLILTKLFHQIYCQIYQLSPPELHFLRFSELFNYKYLLDFFIKNGFAFNIAWPCVFIYFFKFRLNGLKKIPDIFIAWTIAAVLYIGAAYSHNDLGNGYGYGYPLRISYALFPLIFLFTTHTLTSFKHKKIIITFYLVLSLLINITGVLLDPNTSSVTYENVLEKIDIR